MLIINILLFAPKHSRPLAISVNGSSNLQTVLAIFLTTDSFYLHPNSSPNRIFLTVNLMSIELTCRTNHVYSPAFQTQHPACFHETRSPKYQCRCKFYTSQRARAAKVLETFTKVNKISGTLLVILLVQVTISLVRVQSSISPTGLTATAIGKQALHPLSAPFQNGCLLETEMGKRALLPS